MIYQQPPPYPPHQTPYMGGPQIHNIPQQPTYGQTSPFKPYQYYQPLPFLVKLDLSNLS